MQSINQWLLKYPPVGNNYITKQKVGLDYLRVNVVAVDNDKVVCKMVHTKTTLTYSLAAFNIYYEPL